MKIKILASIKLGDEEEHTFNPLGLTWDRSDLRDGRCIRISFMVLPLQEMMEINLSVFYSTVIFSQVRLSPFLPQLFTTTMNTGFVAGTFFLPKTIERVVKRGVLIWSLVVLTICMIVFIALIELENKSNTTAGRCCSSSDI
jgi:Sugar (and other) transporter